MVKKYVYGKPYNTGAVIEEVAPGKDKLCFEVEKIDGCLNFSCGLLPDEPVYGLGQTMRGINKRGARYISYNTDDPDHRGDMPSLYGSHNFVVVGDRFGAFFDTPSKVVFDIDVDGSAKLNVLCHTADVNLYIVEGASAYGTVKEFLKITGKSYIPPLWAFGFGQSRWGYKDEDDINAVVSGYKKAEIPLDYICLDIDYMDGYKDFSVDKTRFPDLKRYVEKLKSAGVRLVPIIDAGVKVEAGDAVYEEGVKNGFFCTGENGKPFGVAVWPGMTHLPDFFQPGAREWFGRKYKFLTDCGIEGVWNDMNEPAVFYSELSDPENGLHGEGSNAYEDYFRFYHNIDGAKVLHHSVHNLYGALMTRASGEGLDKLLNTRYLLFSRSTYIGSHRYGGMWTGDINSSFEHLKQEFMQLPNLNACGFLYCGGDTGGFNGDCTRELLLRWLAVSAFTPLMRNHSACGTAAQECFAFGDTADFKNIIDFRYKILPYLYSEFVKAALCGDMFIKPLAFGFPGDKRAEEIDDQLLVGEGIMIAPVMEEGKVSRSVYLPEDMTMVRYNGEFICKSVKAGQIQINVGLGEVVFFILKDKAVIVCGGAENTSKLDLANVTLLGGGEYEQYLDDGFTKNISRDNIRTVR